MKRLIVAAVILVPPFVLLAVLAERIWQTLEDIDAGGSPL